MGPLVSMTAWKFTRAQTITEPRFLKLNTSHQLTYYIDRHEQAVAWCAVWA